MPTRSTLSDCTLHRDFDRKTTQIYVAERRLAQKTIGEWMQATSGVSGEDKSAVRFASDNKMQQVSTPSVNQGTSSEHMHGATPNHRAFQDQSILDA